jgi:CheY-like chemotaxis protein
LITFIDDEHFGACPKRHRDKAVERPALGTSEQGVFEGSGLSQTKSKEVSKWYIYGRFFVSVPIKLDYLKIDGQYKGRTDLPQPGLIFLDINMPGMNGWEFLEEYQRLPEERKARAVVAMLTTSANPEDELNAKKHRNLQDFQIKPLTKEMLLRVIDENF